MSIASQFNAAKDFTEALLDSTHPNLTVRAIASRKAEEAFQRLVKARGETDLSHRRSTSEASLQLSPLPVVPT